MQRGFAGIFLAVGLLLAALAGSWYFIQVQNAKPVVSPVRAVQPPTPTPSPWKTYTNNKYGFIIDYPIEGVIHQEDEYLEGECGQAIKEEKGGKIVFDNLFEMQIVPWKGSVDEYLISKGAKNAYESELLTGSGADEAIHLVGLKKDFEVAVGYPPLVYTHYVYKKGENIFTVKTPPTHNNPGGCVNPNIIDPVKYAKYQKEGWDFAKSFRFTSN